MRSLTIILAALLLIIPLASAATTINLKTLSGHDVFISIWSEGFDSQISSPKKYLSDIYGEVQHVYDGTTSPFGVLVIIKSFGVQKYREEFGPYNVGDTVQLPDLLPEDYVDPFASEGTDNQSQETEQEVEEQQNISQEETQNPLNDTHIVNDTNTTSITGNAIAEDILNSKMTVTVLYVLGAIFVACILVAIIIFIIKKIRSPKNIPYGMEPVNLNVKYRPDPSGDKYLNSIEKEIDNVERQIEQYKKRNRLEDAQRRLEEKKRVLEKIKRGESTDSSSSSREDRENKYKKRFY